ncbi:hypothetical protein HTT03_15710 [Sulfitobacter sp. S0837]|uniref:hypothetical protein n=1 Tax=Sulfitobacter maritimus TaxID=2741719 RepID=UPI001583AC96|nr:hypothetical protein [Sulfitobacter maritimus]NUH66728.1 hypothetical protein [Sulfitobacter maritimus]
MITWTSKSPFAALALLTLSACEGGQGFSFARNTASTSTPLLSASLAGGAVDVVPPQGYCIDRESLKRHFALMARCDALGLPDQASGAPKGILTLSLIEATPDQPLPTPQDVASAAGLTQVRETDSGDGLTLFIAEGPAPTDGMSGRHWRGMAQIGGHIASVTLYGAPQSPAISDAGRALVTDLIRRTRAKTGDQPSV